MRYIIIALSIFCFSCGNVVNTDTTIQDEVNILKKFRPGCISIVRTGYGEYSITYPDKVEFYFMRHGKYPELTGTEKNLK